MKRGTDSLWTIKDLDGIEGRTLDPKRIDVLDDLLKSTYGPNVSVQSADRLRSKKNIVLHLVLSHNSTKFNIVAKLFIAKSFGIETEVLTLGTRESLFVPSIVIAQDGVLLMEYIDGIPLVDAVNEEFALSLIEKIARWYYIFHHKTGHIKGDPRLRNFILAKGEIYGIDFEEYRRDHWMQDIGGVCASILDTRPMFDKRKRKLVWHLLETYLKFSGQQLTESIDTHFTEVIAATLEQTAHWRGDSQILEQAKNIRIHGLPSE